MLDAELQRNIVKGPLGPMIHHPLIIMLSLNHVEPEKINTFFQFKKAELQAALEQEDFARYVFAHERPYRLDAFRKIAGKLDSDEFWKIAGQVWTDSENIWQHKTDWLNIWNADMPGRLFAMDEAEQEAFHNLPERFTVYRGSNHFQNRKSLSWTLNRDKAHWFAGRFRRKGCKPHVLSGTVRKKDVFAHFLGRNEAEIVIDQRNVKVFGVETFK